MTKKNSKNDCSKENCIQERDIYLTEYGIVTSKITSLSLKFASGSYIIPISLIIGAASFSFDNLFLTTIAMFLPVLIFFQFYNHLRYMALQFKLSGYARYLEDQLNTFASTDKRTRVLLWEGYLARSSKQNLFEGVFIGITYLLVCVLILFIAFKEIAELFIQHYLPTIIVIIVPAIYYYSLFSVLFFLTFFTNVHEKSYKFSNSLHYKTESTTVHKQLLWWKIIVFLIIIICTPLSIMPLVYKPAQYTNTRLPIDEYDYIVVLGNKSINNTPSTDTRARLNGLIEIITDESKATVVLSGGEAILMNTFLQKLYFSHSIVLEDGSTNTFENFQNIKSLVSGNVLIITSDYHVFRSMIISQNMGASYDFFPVKTTDNSFFKSVLECYCSYYYMFY